MIPLTMATILSQMKHIWPYIVSYVTGIHSGIDRLLLDWTTWITEQLGHM